MILTSLTPMKTVSRLMVLFFVLFISITACEDQQEHPLQTGIDQNDLDNVATEEDLQTAYEDIDLISVEVEESLDAGAVVGGRMRMDETDRLTRCATITHNKEEMTITIDFGDGCKGPDGKFRSGIIFINYTGRLFVPGSVWIITFGEYFVNRRHIEGTKTITNVSGSINDHVSFHKVLEGGKITWPDGSYATREVDKTFTWYRAHNPLMDEWHEEGKAHGVNRRGVSYKMTILSALIWKRACRVRGVCIPVQGYKLIERRELPDVLVDFGHGECDNMVTITKNGESREVEKDCHRND